MPDVATALKAEITRLARKEIKQQVGPLKKTVAEQRRTIAGLKRQVAALVRSDALVQEQGKRRLAETPTATTSARVRFFAEVGESRPHAPRALREGLRPPRRRLGADHLRLGGGQVEAARDSAGWVGGSAWDREAGGVTPTGTAEVSPR